MFRYLMCACNVHFPAIIAFALADFHYLCRPNTDAMNGIFCILLCWVVGQAVSLCIDNYISGNIVGMILLFVALRLRVFDAATVRPAAKFLLGTMSLYFVPFGVGLMVSYNSIIDNFWAILVGCVVGTIVVLVVTGGLFQLLDKHSQK